MAHRSFKDSSGIEWEVWEVHPTLTERRLLADRRALRRSTTERRVSTEERVALDRDLRRGWLAFRSKWERRRRTPVPDGWLSFSDEQLRALLGESRFSGPVRRLAE